MTGRLQPCLLAAALAVGGSVQASPNGPPLQFADFTQYPTTNNSTGIDAADFDGDGLLDLVTANRDTNDVTVLLQRPGGGFEPGVHVPVGLFPRYVIAADLDADCDQDLATVEGDGNVTILRNTGDGTFVPHAVIPIFRGTWLDSADFDLDGDIDIVVTHLDEDLKSPGSGSAKLTIIRSVGGSFVASGPWTIGRWPRGGAVADFNGDGWPDVAVANLSSNALSIMLNDQAGGFAPQIWVPTGAEPRYLTATDVDGDGDTDLAVIHKLLDDMWIHRNDGTSTFTVDNEDKYAVHDNPHGIDAADLDGDGDADLAVCHVGDAFIDLMVNDGTGSLHTQTIPAAPGSAHVIAVDLEGDGDFDLATANGWAAQGHATVLANVTPQGIAPAACVGDINGNRMVDFGDLLLVLARWGDCDQCVACTADLDGDGTVGFIDLLSLLAAWGPCQ
ncbi:MAG: VCBS repeat-containing protein [Phycisphaerales bacterium]|nr:VCBS repeat-containing protein [Phycisphaerales bacterium]NNM25810.1 VCBS repeat-containing protein [Phycisphaerales bacterium]